MMIRVQWVYDDHARRFIKSEFGSDGRTKIEQLIRIDNWEKIEQPIRIDNCEWKKVITCVEPRDISERQLDGRQ